MKRFARIRVFSDTLAGRIFASLAIVTTLALLIFFLVASAVTYNVYEGTAERALREEVAPAAQVLEALPADERAEIATDQFAADRITLIDAEGNVVFDSQAPDGALSNHKTRPEIEQAQNGPDAVVLRHSETLNTDTLYAAAQNMRALIDDVLTLSRLDEPTPDRQMAPVNLYALTEVVKTRLIAIASPKGITVRVSTDSASLCEVLGSRMLLEQMVYNLLDNAIRYAPCDSRIDAVISSGEDSVGLAVIDRGPGIPSELREAVFERFYRTDKSRSKETGGTGLGLAIVKHVVELHDGSIEVSETPGGGATFKVSIPKDRIVPTSKAGTDR